MRAVVDSVNCSVEESEANFTPVSISTANIATVNKIGSAQMFRIKVAITVTTLTSVAGVVQFVVLTMPSVAFRITSLALELLTLTVSGAPVQLDVSLFYRAKELMLKAPFGNFTGNTYPTTTQRRWGTMQEFPGGAAGTGGLGNDGYFVGTTGAEALFYGGVYLGDSFAVNLATSSATGVVNGTMNLHATGHYLG